MNNKNLAVSKKLFSMKIKHHHCHTKKPAELEHNHAEYSKCLSHIKCFIHKKFHDNTPLSLPVSLLKKNTHFCLISEFLISNSPGATVVTHPPSNT